MKYALVLLSSLLVGCSYLEKGIDAAVDGAAGYCTHNPTPAGRAAVRNSVRQSVNDEGLEICLGCPGDEKTYCVGNSKEKVSDI